MGSTLHERFVEEYLVDLNATAAYARTYPDATPGSCRTLGSRLLAKVDIQAAVNRRYIATQDEAIAAVLAPPAATIQALAAAQALRDFGAKSDGKLPTTIVGLPPQMGVLLDSLLKSTAPAPPAPK